MEFNDVKKFIAEHYQYVAVGVLFVLLVIVLIVFSVQRGKGDNKGSKVAETTESSEEVSTEPIPVPDNLTLEQNAYEEINSFFTKYYKALAEADFDTLESLGETLSDDDKAKKSVRATYTEDYENMSCYTVAGPEENSFIVFVYYEIKFKNIDTLAPGLSTFYLIKNGKDYSLKSISTLPENEKQYITEVAGVDDVNSLLEEVDTLYQKNMESDPTLAAFMTSLQTKVDAADSSTISADNSATEEADAATVRVTTTDTVNVRSTPDENGEKVGTAMAGDSFVRLSEENGWSKIQYKDTEAYVRSDFLTTAQGDTVVAGQVASDESANTNTEEAAQPAETPAAAEETTTSNETSSTDSDSVKGKKVVVSEPITVRGEASTDAAKIGSAYKGDTYKIYGKEGDWYKIDYKGSTGYVRSDVVSVQ